MDTNLQEFSSTLKEFKQSLQTTRFGSQKDFTTRENTKPLRELEEHPLSPELRYLYSNYITLLILPHIHINTYSSLFPKMHIFGKTGAMSSNTIPGKKVKLLLDILLINRADKYGQIPLKTSPLFTLQI